MHYSHSVKDRHMASIPDEAVEAAAKALWDVDRDPGTREYEDCRDGSKRHLRREARAVLEAAVPHMLAEVQASAIENAANNCGDERTGAWLRFHAAGIRKGRLSPPVKDRRMTAIPDEALEVAYAEADTIPQSIIRRAVEAAAPHLLAEAYDRGFTARSCEGIRQREDPSHPITRTNPYRPTA